MNKYNIGQIFYDGTCPSDLADFCNNSQGTENACYIKEIEPLDGKRRFQIVPNDPIPEEEIAHQRIMEIQQYLNETDWYVTRFMDTGEPVPEEVRKKRQEARDEISRLREEYNLS